MSIISFESENVLQAVNVQTQAIVNSIIVMRKLMVYYVSKFITNMLKRNKKKLGMEHGESGDVILNNIGFVEGIYCRLEILCIYIFLILFF